MNVTVLESTAYVRTHVLQVMGRILFVCCIERPLVGDKEKTYTSQQMPLSFVGFAWLLGGLRPLGMNGWGSGAIHGGKGVHFWGVSCPLQWGRTLVVSVCFCPPMVCCSVDQAVCLYAVCCGT